MYKISFHKPVHVHFIGIGGISMSGLASVLLKEGFTVSGSDSKESPLTDDLAAHGAKIQIGQKAENITGDIDLVVYTAAVHADNPEYAAVVAAGIPMLTRAQLLGQIMDHYSKSVAVAGTHGKTTTTSMLSHITLAADMDPTISVGGILHAIGGNIRVGSSETFIAEACEYTNSFLSLNPFVGIILDIDADHLDFFKDLDDIRHSFHLFAENIPAEGYLIVNGNEDNLDELTAGLKCHIVTFGAATSDYAPQNMSFDENGFGSFDLLIKGENVGRFTLSVPGEHNILNACAALAAAHLLGADIDAMKTGIKSFTGTNRRFEKKGERNGYTIVDDYAHHPTEIRATLSAAENYPHNKLWLIFQPHTYTRTKSLLPEFASALALADHVIMADIYAARETDTLGISSETVQKLILEKGTPAEYLKSFAEIEDFIDANAKEGDLVITMGAGDVVKIGEELLERN